MKTLTAIAAIILIAGQLSAQPLGRIDAFAGELGLDTKQADQIKELAYKAEKEVISIRAQLKTAQLDLRYMLDKAKASEGQIVAQVEKVGQLQTEMRKNRVLLMYRVRKLLTREQFEKLQQLLPKHRRGGKHGPRHRRGPRGGFGGPPVEPPPDDAE